MLVIDGGGAVRRGLIDAELAQLAVDNGWEGIIVYGAVRQIQQLENLDIGIHACRQFQSVQMKAVLARVIFQ